MKKFLTAILSLCAAAVMLFSGCGLLSGADGIDGRDGKDGTSVTIYDAYEAAKAERPDLSFDDFLKEYLSYSGGQVSLQANINRSLMSSVTILSRHKYRTGSFMGNASYRYKIYTGSGVILSVDKEKGDAYVVTNCHVVYDDSSSDSNYICEYVRLYLYGQDVDGVNFTCSEDESVIEDSGYGMAAKVIGASVTYDIALLKVEGSDVVKRNEIYAASFAEEEDVFIGETVYAVGNAESEGLSATNGIIAKDSEFIEVKISESSSASAVTYRVLRTTAPINHGNSGGGLFNANGEIVGIVNAKADGEDVDNLGYALPANLVKRLLKLMGDSYNGNFVMGIKKAYLGVETQVSDSFARYDGEKGRAVIYETVRVKKVSDAPAYGKLKAGDIFKSVRIVSADGAEKENLSITREYHLRDVLFSVRYGDTIHITVERNGAEVPVQITYSVPAYFKSVG